MSAFLSNIECSPYFWLVPALLLVLSLVLFWLDRTR